MRKLLKKANLTEEVDILMETIYLDGGGWKRWLTGEDGRFLPKIEHEQQYCSDKGGMLIVSSYEACDGWNW
jgi:hypothetical protein